MIARLLQWYADTPFFVRTLVTFILLAVTGSAFVAFLSTYATYWFAFRYGARIPVEGVPYLALSVAILGFFYLCCIHINNRRGICLGSSHVISSEEKRVLVYSIHVHLYNIF